MPWKTIALLIGLAIVAHVRAQWGWEQVLEVDASATWALHAVDIGNGDVYVTVREQVIAGGDDERAHVYHLGSDGELIDETQLVWGTHIVSTSRILFAPHEGTLNVMGAIRDGDPQNSAHAACLAFFKLDLALNPLFSGTYGTCGEQYGYMTACIGVDSTVAVGYTIMQSSGTGEQQLHTLKLSLNGDSLAGQHLMSIEGWGSVDAIRFQPNGGYVMMVDGFDLFGLNGVGYVVYLDDDGVPIVGNRLEPMGDEPHVLFDFPGNPLDVFLVENGELIVSGVYWRTLENRGPLVRRIDSTGYTLAQWESDSPYHNDDPPLIQGLDRTPNGSILFAQSENSAGFWTPVAPVVEPTRVRLLQLDTALTVLAEYVIDGFNENKYYHLATVIAAQDGGAFLLGAVTDLNEANGRPKAWIRKIGPDEFVTVSEYDRPQAMLFPNPGITDFEVWLSKPLSGGFLTMTDAQGRLVYSSIVNGSHIHVPADRLADGIYLLRIVNAEGGVIHAGQWIKE